MNFSDILILSLILLCLISALRFIRRKRKNGGCGCSSCGGNCASCRMNGGSPGKGKKHD